MSFGSALAVRRPPDFAAQRLSVSLAASPEEVKEAQRLRHRVFVEELGTRMGARLGALERDRFDPFCRHLIVRDRCTGRVVGTYRILTPERAAALGAFMAEREFDLTPLTPLRASMVEVGRACIDAEYRCGSTIMLLWSGLASYARARRFEFLFGCASVGLGAEQQCEARAVYEMVALRHLAPEQYRVEPRIPIIDGVGAAKIPTRLPPLLKGYLRAGAWVCGEPAWDPEDETADLLVLLPLARVEARYAHHFLRDSAIA